MAELPIITFPDDNLRIISKEITVFDSNVKTLINDMLETMYKMNAIGLAAPQVGCNERIIVVDISKEKNKPFYLINPEVIHSSGGIKFPDRCLSLPGIYGDVRRPERLKIKYNDLFGNQLKLEAEEIMASVIHHEIDHLNGVLFIDYLLAG